MIKNSHILFDTCILNNLLSKEFFLRDQTKLLFKELTNLGNILYVSEFTKYELLRDANLNKKMAFGELLNTFRVITNSRDRLERAVKLYESYKHEPSINSILHSISDVDIFIGSLIFTDQKPYLLTADFADFPRPFFVERDIFPIEFRRPRGNMNCLYYYLLQANI
ncbi:hypothetical protein HZA40_00850 [Candidatus Peregrinibacteria bacterium]|nr:hypothetical protein [Candidatus Peregrinibacteria bacterium]